MEKWGKKKEEGMRRKITAGHWVISVWQGTVLGVKHFELSWLYAAKINIK